MMKPYLTVVLTLTSLLGLGMSARAQDTDGVRVKVPFQFVSGGTTLSAGTYTIGPVSHAASRILSIRGYNKKRIVLANCVRSICDWADKARLRVFRGQVFSSRS
jgi:hypothetical protein